MPVYAYTARTAEGELVKDTVQAASEAAMEQIMRERNMILLSMKEQREWDFLSRFSGITQHVKTKDVVVFSRQLAVLISATVPIVRALRILSKQSQSKVMQTVISDIADEVDGGARLSAAMHRHLHVFDDFFVYMVRAGETTGRLDEVLVYLADQKEKDYQLISRIISSLIYPAFIIVVLFSVFIFMMVYVVPKLLAIVTESGAPLPFVTQVLLVISTTMQNYWWAIVGVLVILAAVYLVARSTPNGRLALDRIKLGIPVMGSIFQKIYLARISRSLSNLLGSGVPINRSIEIVSDVVGNRVYKSIMEEARQDVEGGMALSTSLQKHKQVPPIMTQMMSIGEETGRLDQILVKVSDFYVSEVTSLTQALVSLIEPIIIILLGLGALTLIAGILMPIYSVTSSI